LEIKGRNIIAPLRLPVLDRYTDRGTIAMGKVESGIIQQGMKITLMPTRNVCKIDGIWINEEQVNSARPGENVLVKLNNTGTEDVIKGFVICSNPPCRSVKKLIGHIGLMDMPDSCKIFTAGLQTMFHAHTCEEECTIIKLFETTNNKGHVIKKPRFASIGMKVICMIEMSQTIPIETYDEMPFLGGNLMTFPIAMVFPSVRSVNRPRKGISSYVSIGIV
jgi:peptide chain release factor subunit 3